MSADAGMALVRALARAAQASGATLELVEIASRPWSSALFSGERHRLTVVLRGPEEVDVWAEELPEADLPMPGHVVIDLAVRSVDRGPLSMTVELEAATLAEQERLNRPTAALRRA